MSWLFPNNPAWIKKKHELGLEVPIKQHDVIAHLYDVDKENAINQFFSGEV